MTDELKLTFGPTIEKPYFMELIKLNERHRRWRAAKHSVLTARLTGHFAIWVLNGHMRDGVSLRQTILDYEHWIATYVGWPDIGYRP